MTIELPCGGCGQQLRVRDEDAGRKAMCPQCGHVSQIPLDRRPTSPSGATASPDVGEPLPGARQTPLSRPSWGVPGPQNNSPHHGILVVVLGVLGLVTAPCCVGFSLGLIAWILGANDLSAMRQGQMDPSGEGLSRAGMILGIISTVLSGMALMFWLGVTMR